MDTAKSLQELDGQDWGGPDGAPTNLVRRCLELRRVPLDRLSAEDCRLLLGQKINPEFVVPVALKFLGEDPLEEGTIGVPGALLSNILSLAADFWRVHPELWWEVREIVGVVESVRAAIEQMEPMFQQFEAAGEP